MLTFYGSDVGQLLTLPLCGYLVETLGWQYGFYIPAIMFALFLCIWYFLVYDKPENYPRISSKEKEYIERETTGVAKELKVVLFSCDFNIKKIFNII